MDTDIMTRLEKQIEGNGLALSAVAEVLQKMDARLNKADDEEKAAEEEQAEREEVESAEMEKAELIKSIAGEVTNLIKGVGESKQGMDVDGENVRSATKTGTAKSADDSETAITTDTKTENVQGIIQAMQKELNLLKEGYNFDVPDDDDGSATVPVTDEDDEDENDENGDTDNAIQNMQKQILSLKKQFATVGQDNSLQSIVKRESEERLRKMGFREETSLQGPQLVKYDDPTAIGVDGTTPIKKASSPEETVDELANLSYKQLRDMQASIELGETDGLPKELVG